MAIPHKVQCWDLRRLVDAVRRCGAPATYLVSLNGPASVLQYVIQRRAYGSDLSVIATAGQTATQSADVHRGRGFGGKPSPIRPVPHGLTGNLASIGRGSSPLALTMRLPAGLELIPGSWWFLQRLETLEEPWCHDRDSNPGPQPYQGCALPLSYRGERRGGAIANTGPRVKPQSTAPRP